MPDKTEHCQEIDTCTRALGENIEWACEHCPSKSPEMVKQLKAERFFKDILGCDQIRCGVTEGAQCINFIIVQ